jgi:glutathione S-transferase
MSDFEALSNWLGDKPYMMGSAPCVLDCSAFGFLAIFYYIFPETYYLRKETETKFPNLKEYCDRMKAEFWPDWDELLDKN